MIDTSPEVLPEREFERLVELADYGLDYEGLQEHLDDLTQLAAAVTGAPVSMINLIDRHTQWTVARQGSGLRQMPRGDSVCQHTILGEGPLAIDDLRLDERTRDKFYVTAPNGFRYYYGVPLTDSRGWKLGALCVLDHEPRPLGEKERAMLEQISRTVARRLDWIRQTHQLRARLKRMSEQQRRVSHDIRGPIGGVVGLAALLQEQLRSLDPAKAELAGMIHDTGSEVLAFCDKLLLKPEILEVAELGELVARLEGMFRPQAVAKGVELTIGGRPPELVLPCDITLLIQIVGNLLSNAIKFTPAGGKVSVDISEHNGESGRSLEVVVSDNGVGMSPELPMQLMQDEVTSTAGTHGESGFGLGLKLVRHLVRQAGGCFQLAPNADVGSRVGISLPFV